MDLELGLNLYVHWDFCFNFFFIILYFWLHMLDKADQTIRFSVNVKIPAS